MHQLFFGQIKLFSTEQLLYARIMLLYENIYILYPIYMLYQKIGKEQKQ